MKIIPIKAFVDNYIWLLVKNQKAIAVDPGESEPVLTYLKAHALDLTAILLTHHHHDHIGGVKALVKIYPQVLIFGPHDERIDFSYQKVEEHSTLTLLEHAFEVLAIPGHTSTHIAYYEKKQPWLFCGDTLFSGGCGRVFDSTYENLFASLQRLQMLPLETQVYCAHEYTRKNLAFAKIVEPHNPTILTYIQKIDADPFACTLPSTIAKEQQINPFLRTHIPEVQAYTIQQNCLNLNQLDIFKQLREDKNRF